MRAVALREVLVGKKRGAKATKREPRAPVYTGVKPKSAGSGALRKAVARHFSQLRGRHLLSIRDLTKEEILFLLDLAAELKRRPRNVPGEPLRGKILALLFQKPSTRTRVSFEAAMLLAGGRSLYLGGSEMQVSRGESWQDTARVLSRYCDGIVARVFSHADLVELSRFSSVPVINGLSDFSHPCQILGDLLTAKERFGKLRELCWSYVGDGNNILHSLLYAAGRVGFTLQVATPRGYEPSQPVLSFARKESDRNGGRVELFREPAEAVRGADIVYTDVWTSMGQEKEEKERLRAFRGYIVNRKLMQRAKPTAVFLHCLPAHRGLEVAAEVLDGPQSIVFDQAENRLHIQKAILLSVLGSGGRP